MEVEECCLQCARVLLRSTLWERPQSLKTPPLFSFAQILIDQTKAEETVASLEQKIRQSCADRLY
jgi:hypothetical protein